ncbi:hypothetical protein BC351_00705 [Paenibacillus ferrarius]|uniref:HTH cro/C1-type domain-containing protein n=1 Tax=Paenibacillus ferrarius TaxID=1469647 RepID=A0A1V4HTG3_9BACL|nr:LexA family transcriptional regulator [Paenibacillus ferrarius]OPH61793.1 hypothetical protein BC351_00705 [Paenibacillus ferrarius]
MVKSDLSASNRFLSDATKSLQATFGECVKLARNQKGLSLRKLGEITGISYSHLSKIERGEHSPEKATIDNLANTLDLNKEDLYILAGYVPKSYIIESTVGSGKSMFIKQMLKGKYGENNIKYVPINDELDLNDLHYNNILKTIFDMYQKLITDQDFESILSKHYRSFFAIPEDRKEEFYKILLHEKFELLDDKDKFKLIEIVDLRNSLARAEVAANLEENNINNLIITKSLTRSSDKINELMQNFGSVNRINNRVDNDSFIQIPIYGEIKAGYDFLGEQNVIGYEITSKNSISDGEYFYLKVKGDSMIDDGIIDGCKVLVKKQSNVENGKIGVVIINNEEATLKRVFYEGNKVILMAANKSENILPRTYDLNEVLIQGQVKSYVVDL